MTYMVYFVNLGIEKKKFYAYIHQILAFIAGIGNKEDQKKTWFA